MPYLILLIVALVAMVFFFQYWYVTIPLTLLVVAAFKAPRVIRLIRKNRYFASEAFLAQKAAIASVVAEHNDVAKYTAEIRAAGTFKIGASATGTHSHLAVYQNTSRHNYVRDRNVADFSAPNVHNCSLQVVRNAKADPLKYLMKYFDIKANEPTLENIEELGDSIARLENAVENLRRREITITRSINPPEFILKYFEDEFMDHIGVHLSPISVPHPVYSFEYVSAGGNSSQRTDIRLDTPTIDALVETLSEKIKFNKSAAGQRALMTAKLRGFIKQRDNFACISCSASVSAEPNLLLEVDHIIPVSRGGLSTIENLQTLCWRCNRTKSNKLPSS